MAYVLVAFAVYLLLVGVLIASAPWWGVAVVVGCLLWLAAAMAPEAGRALAQSAAVLAREPDDA